LEDSLLDFPGAVILVTHDRMMLHSVANHILALDGNGGAETFSDYEQCEEMLDRFLSPKQGSKGGQGNKDKSNQSEKDKGSKEKKEQGRSDGTQLTQPEKRELAALPERIDKLETELKEIQKEMSKTSVSANYTKLQDLDKQQTFKQNELDAMFKRWEELDAKAAALKT
jgi:ATP-binding cassette subfamily F protein uup